jgi:hypothetical protein
MVWKVLDFDEQEAVEVVDWFGLISRLRLYMELFVGSVVQQSI